MVRKKADEAMPEEGWPLWSCAAVGLLTWGYCEVGALRLIASSSCPPVFPQVSPEGGPAEGHPRGPAEDRVGLPLPT